MDLQFDSTQLAFLIGTSLALGTAVVRKERRTVVKRRRTRLPPNCILDPIRDPVFCEKKEPARASTDVIRFFHTVSQNDAWLIGGKGANLGELVQAGFPVPAGFCVTKVAFDQHMRRNLPNSSTTLSQIIENDGEMSAAAARALVLESPCSSEMVESIKAAYRSLCTSTGSNNLLVAVRSSATAEDSAEASFAGQLETFLGVEGEDEVVRAVKECWASLYSDRVDSYRRMVGKGRGTNESSISVCVVVQQMLDADCAGVMFTANPFTQALDEIVITGNWGLGESVVADIASPDTWEITEPSPGQFKIKSESIAQKKKKVVLSQRKPQGHHQGCSEIVDIIDFAEQSRPCLTHAQLFDLARLARKVQAHYGNHPQDTEWGLKEGKVYLLQARPITTLSDEPPRTMNEFDAICRPDDWITTCNAAEMFPGAMTPLTMSTFGRMADQGVQRMQVVIGCRDKIDLVHRVSVNYYGNFFLNMSNTLAPMVAGMVGSQMTKDNGEMSILGSRNQGETLERLVKLSGGPKFIGRRLFNGARYAKTMLSARSRVPIMRRRIVECEKEFDVLFSTAPTSAVIWSHIDSLMDAFDDQWTDGIITSSTSAAAMLFAMKLLTERGGNIWGTQPVAELAVLLGEETGEGTAESAGAVEAIDKLRDLVANDHDGTHSASAFASSAPEEALSWMQSKPVLKKEFDHLVARHGHRCVREAEMREKDWSEDPIPLVRMLQSSVRAALLRKDEAVPAAKVGLAPEDVIASKKHLNFITRPLLRYLVKITRKSVHLRELGKSLQIKLNAIFKHAYRKLGHQLAKEGRLPEADLLYFLTHEEIGRLACTPLTDMDVHRMKTRAAQRRRLFPRQGQLKFPELSQGVPKPIVRLQGKEGAVGASYTGTPVSAGIARGPARVARTLDEAEHLKEGEILITPQTDVGWTPYFSVAAGLITEIGGMLSHGAVVAREYSLPCVVGVTDACDIIKTGTIIELDGDCGRIVVVSIS